MTDLDTELQTEREAMHRDALERLEHTLRSEAAHAYETLEKAKDAQIKNLKEQSEYFLSAKDRETGELRRRADARERETTAETARLNAQVEYLHRWALAMNQIIRKVEDGSYRVAERAGARTLAIPARELPKSLDVRILADRADAARAFLEEIGGGADGAARSEGAARGGADDDAAYLVSASNAGDAFELESFRRHGRLVDEERAAVQEATLKELSAHPTVEYIRHLEEENRRVVRELSKERRSVSDMRVALNSARRARQKDAVEFARAASARSRSRTPAEMTTGALFGASTTLRGTGVRISRRERTRANRRASRSARRRREPGPARPIDRRSRRSRATRPRKRRKACSPRRGLTKTKTPTRRRGTTRRDRRVADQVADRVSSPRPGPRPAFIPPR